MEKSDRRRDTGQLFLGLVGILCWMLAGCGAREGRDTAPMQARESHRQMLEVLEAVRVHSAEAHPYLGQGQARRLRAQLAAVRAETATRSSELHFRLGMAELNLGHERQAIAHLDTALHLFASTGGSASMVNALRFRLGLAWLRLGETQNCVLDHSANSCILPIGADGVHALREGSRNALPLFQAVLDHTPPYESGHLSARWLLNIAHMTLGQYPDGVPPAYLIPPQTFQAPTPFARLVNIGPALGLDTFSLSGGAVADDFDGDGYLDLMVSTWDTGASLGFFRNQGDGTFAERT